MILIILLKTNIPKGKPRFWLTIRTSFFRWELQFIDNESIQIRSSASVFGRLVGDVLQLTGFLCYCGPFNQSYRDMLLKDIWETELRTHKIPFTENLNLISDLVDPPTVRTTHSCFTI